MVEPRFKTCNKYSFTAQNIRYIILKSLSHVQLFAILCTVAHQAPPSMGLSRQEYWSGLPFPSPRKEIFCITYNISNTNYHSLAFRQIRELELGRERVGERCRICPISLKLIMPSQMKGHIVFPNMVSRHGTSSAYSVVTVPDIRS